MTQVFTLGLLLSATFSYGQSTEFGIYMAPRRDTIPCTMIVSSLFATDGIKQIGNSPTDSAHYFFANVFQIRGYQVTPKHSETFYLDEQRRRMPFLHVWLSFPYNYHADLEDSRHNSAVQFEPERSKPSQPFPLYGEENNSLIKMFQLADGRWVARYVTSMRFTIPPVYFYKYDTLPSTGKSMPNTILNYMQQLKLLSEKP